MSPSTIGIPWGVSAWLTLDLMWDLRAIQWLQQCRDALDCSGLPVLPARSMAEVQESMSETKMEKSLNTTLTDVTTLLGPG